MLYTPVQSIGPEERVLLALTRLRAEREARRDETRAALADCDQARLGDLLYEQGVLAVHGARLLELAGDAVAPDFAERVRTAATLNGRRAVVLEKVLDDALGALAAHGIGAIPFKGPRLARAAHGNPAMRSSVDLDVLVDPDHLPAAAEALADAGFELAVDRLRPDGLPELHLTLVHREPWGPRLDLHWRVHWADTGHARWMLGRATAEAGGLLRADPADALAIVLLCYARDGFVGVRLATDIGGWWDHHGTELPAPALEPLLAAHPALSPALAAGVRAVADLTGLPAEALLERASLERAPDRALRLVDPVASGDPQQLRAQTALVEWATIPRSERRGFARRRMAHAAETGGVDGVLHLPKLAVRAAWAAVRGPSS